MHGFLISMHCAKAETEICHDKKLINFSPIDLNSFYFGVQFIHGASFFKLYEWFVDSFLLS